MHAFSVFLSHGGYIYYINLSGTDDEYKNRVVFLICDRCYYVAGSPTDATNVYHAPRSSTFTNYDTRSVNTNLCIR